MTVPPFTDGAVFLRPLKAEDAAAHLAGEDDAMARWASGGRSTPVTVAAAIDHWQENWRTGGPRRNFGIFDCQTGRLVGFVEANLARFAGPGQVNVSYGIFSPWRGRGIALRAIDLVVEYLRRATDARGIVLRIAPENTASIRVAEKGGFVFVGVFDEPEGRLARYIREIR